MFAALIVVSFFAAQIFLEVWPAADAVVPQASASPIRKVNYWALLRAGGQAECEHSHPTRNVLLKSVIVTDKPNQMIAVCVDRETQAEMIDPYTLYPG